MLALVTTTSCIYNHGLGANTLHCTRRKTSDQKYVATNTNCL